MDVEDHGRLELERWGARILDLAAVSLNELEPTPGTTLYVTLSGGGSIVVDGGHHQADRNHLVAVADQARAVAIAGPMGIRLLVVQNGAQQQREVAGS